MILDIVEWQLSLVTFRRATSGVSGQYAAICANAAVRTAVLLSMSSLSHPITTALSAYSYRCLPASKFPISSAAQQRR